ncbi:MAG TPA: glycosyltransferase family 39 protein [Isosphaeraceae bacterium]|nr:glycosyltransferase family 39 protein [Isosphaeraceae bacterium]
MQAIVPVALRAGVGLLLAGAIWLRVTSLESVPELCGDEAWLGAQMARLLQGKPFEHQTFSGNPLNPFFSSMVLALVAIGRPSAWLIRLPAVLSGLAAVWLTYKLGSRVLGRTTAMIAAIGLAALPPAIIFSRTGFDYCQLPFFGMLALYFAFRANAVGALLASAAGVIVHPTAVFLVPAVAAVFLTQAWRRTEGDAHARRWLVMGTLAVSVACAALVGLFTLYRTYVKDYYCDHHDQRPSWSQFLAGFDRFFLGLNLSPHEVPLWKGWLPPVSAGTLRLQDTLFWLTLGSVALIGTRRLWLRRAWDRLALVAGTVASIAGFHLVAGANVLLTPAYRYGVFMIVPVVLSFACLAESVLTEPADAPRLARRRFQLLLLTALGGVLLCCTKWNWFDPRNQGGRESLLTLRSEARDSHRQALDLIRRDAAALAGSQPAGAKAPIVILGEDYWNYRPLQFYSGPSRDVEVYCLTEAAVERDRHRTDLAEAMVAGAYVVGLKGGPVEQALKNAPQDRIKRWELGGHYPKSTVVYRITREGEPAGPTAAHASTWNRSSRPAPAARR